MSAIEYLPYVDALIVFLLLVAYSYYRQSTPSWVYTFTGLFLVYMLIRTWIMLEGANRFLFLQAISVFGALTILYIYYVR